MGWGLLKAGRLCIELVARGGRSYMWLCGESWGGVWGGGEELESGGGGVEGEGVESGEQRVESGDGGEIATFKGFHG